MDLKIHRYDSASRGLPQQTRPARRRRPAHPSPSGWTGPQHRDSGRGESGMAIGPGVKRTSPESLLDIYQAERHPVAARVLRNTMAQSILRRTDDRTKALSDHVSLFLGMDEPRRRLAAEMSGLDVHYDLGEGHPLLGRRMPDLELVTANGPVHVFTHLHKAQPIILTSVSLAPSISLHGLIAFN